MGWGWGSDVQTLLQVTKLRMHTTVDVHLCHVSLGWCFIGNEGKPQLINPLDIIYIKVNTGFAPVWSLNGIAHSQCQLFYK